MNWSKPEEPPAGWRTPVGLEPDRPAGRQEAPDGSRRLVCPAPAKTPLSDEGHQWKVARRAAGPGMGRRPRQHPGHAGRAGRQAGMDLLAGPRPACRWPHHGGQCAVREDRRSGQFLRQPRRRGTGPHRRAAAQGHGSNAPRSSAPPATTRASAAPWPSSATTCAPRPSASGTGRCAAWTTANCSPPPTWPSATRSGIAPSTRPTARRTSTTTACASSPPTAKRCARPPRTSRSTTPGCTA